MGSDTTFSAADGNAPVGESRPEKLVSDPRRLSRLRWRCRRGMLENDLVLERFLALRGDAITEDEVAMLDRLLNLPDNELWDLIVGRTEPADPAAAPLVAALRSPDRSSPTEETR